jgi:HSP20 family protein
MALRDMIHRNDPYKIMKDVLGPMEAFFERPWGLLADSRTARFEVEEKQEEILVTAKLPDMTKEDISIEVTENTLTLRGAKSSSNEQRRHGAVDRRESSQSFVRSFTLPTPIKTSEVRASFKDGSLEIHLPRVTQTPARNVDIA